MEAGATVCLDEAFFAEVLPIFFGASTSISSVGFPSVMEDAASVEFHGYARYPCVQSIPSTLILRLLMTARMIIRWLNGVLGDL